MPTTISKIESGDLYTLLSVCTDEELDPLVKCMVGKPLNFLAEDEDYKQYHPIHTKYHKAIGDHLRRSAGNALRNIFRGTGPPYDAIVIDVCKKLGIHWTVGQTVANERKLLTLYFEGRWEALSEKQREELIAKVRDEAVRQISRAPLLTKAAAPEFLARLAIPMFAAGSLAVRHADLVSGVTVPCVLHIAYLRRTFLETTSKAFDDTASPEQASVPVLAATSAKESEPTAALIIGESEASPVLSLAQIPAPLLPQVWQAVDASGVGISRLNPLLQAVPSLVTAAEAAGVFGTKYMKVVIRGALEPAKGGGFLPLARSVDGKITNLARLWEPSQLAAIVNPAALWQIASVVVAQKHLADISEKLKEIKAGVDRIGQFQKGERRSVLSGATRYFEQVAQSVLSGELPDAVRHQIEHQEAELRKAQDHLTGDIHDEIMKIKEINAEEMFGSKGIYEAIKSHQGSLRELYEQLLLCLRARACGWQLLVAFPGEERLKENRKRDISDALNSLHESGDMLKQTDEFMRQKIRDLSSIWNTDATVNERKLELFEWSPVISANVVSTRKRILQDIQTADAAIRDLQNPVTILAKVEDGRIVAISPA